MSVRSIAAFAVVAIVWSIASAASALPFCELLKEGEIETLPSRLEPLGCEVTKRDGAHKIDFRCTGLAAALHVEREPGSSTIAYAFFNKSVDVGTAFAGCRDQIKAYSVSAFENPLVPFAGSVGAYNSGKHVAVIGAYYYNALLISDEETYGSYRFEESVTDFLTGIFGDGTLRYANTGIQVAGLSIDTSSFDEIKDAIEARDGVLTKEEHSLDVIGDYEFSPIVGVPGLKQIKIKTMRGRVAYFSYAIDGQDNYVSLTQVLDEKYGASNRKAEEGCVRRDWDDAGGFIVGRYCQQKAEPYRIEFYHWGRMTTYAAWLDALQELAKPQDGAVEPTRPAVDKDSL